jgi:hypothetical protein
MEDPYEQQALKKKQRVIKNKLNQLKNLVRSRERIAGSLCDYVTAFPSTVAVR